MVPVSAHDDVIAGIYNVLGTYAYSAYPVFVQIRRVPVLTCAMSQRSTHRTWKIASVLIFFSRKCTCER